MLNQLNEGIYTEYSDTCIYFHYLIKRVLIGEVPIKVLAKRNPRKFVCCCLRGHNFKFKLFRVNWGKCSIEILACLEFCKKEIDFNHKVNSFSFTWSWVQLVLACQYNIQKIFILSLHQRCIPDRVATNMQLAGILCNILFKCLVWYTNNTRQLFQRQWYPYTFYSNIPLFDIRIEFDFCVAFSPVCTTTHPTGISPVRRFFWFSLIYNTGVVRICSRRLILHRDDMTMESPSTFLVLPLLLFVINFSKWSARTEFFAFFAASYIHILFGGDMVMLVLLYDFNSKRCCFMRNKLHVLSLVITRDRNGGS